jgi:A/G-specific adenine glycosylase
MDLRGSRDAALNRSLFAWYRPRERRYPWRRRKPDPYRVLVSEVMLQETQAARVVPAYDEFLRRFPTVRALAEAERADVLRAWNGLGYNRRAVALSEAARAIVGESGGEVPRDRDQLMLLPGVGSYTAAALASIAFGEPVPALDTNVRRVVARFSLGAEPEEVSPIALRRAAERSIDGRQPGRWNQAVMDLGREVCRPVALCDRCPVAGGCRYRLRGRRGRAAGRGQAPFRGSFRQLRGAIVRALAGGGASSVGALAGRTGEPVERVTRAAEALASDGLVRAGREALRGNHSGLVRHG